MGLWPTIDWLAKRAAADDAVVPRGEAVAILARLEQLEADARRGSPSLDEALNSGDGSYKP